MTTLKAMSIQSAFASEPPYDDSADLALAEALNRADPAALGSLYDQYADRLFSYAAKMLGSRDRAADAVQDTMLLAYDRIGQLRDPNRLRPWLYAICRNECLRELRSQNREAELERAPETSESVDMDRDLSASEATEIVSEALVGLTDSDREVIELALRHNLEVAQVAAVLKMSDNHARARLSRARASLEGAVGALLLFKSHQRCAELDEVVGDNGFTPLVRKRISRHSESCAQCLASRRTATRAVAMATLPLLIAPVWLRRKVTEPALEDASLASSRISLDRPPFDRAGWPRYGEESASRNAVLACIAAVALLFIGGSVYIAGIPAEGSPQLAAASPAQTAPTADVVAVAPDAADPTTRTKQPSKPPAANSARPSQPERHSQPVAPQSKNPEPESPEPGSPSVETAPIEPHEATSMPTKPTDPTIYTGPSSDTNTTTTKPQAPKPVVSSAAPLKIPGGITTYKPTLPKPIITTTK